MLRAKENEGTFFLLIVFVDFSFISIYTATDRHGNNSLASSFLIDVYLFILKKKYLAPLNQCSFPHLGADNLLTKQLIPIYLTAKRDTVSNHFRIVYNFRFVKTTQPNKQTSGKTSRSNFLVCILMWL